MTSAQGHKPDDIALPVTIFSHADNAIHVLSSFTPVTILVALAGLIGGVIGWFSKKK